ncbi:hypothetical protein FISHEDRAFT_69936 [Fistulina hepatica ATCC 64428]|uniref:Uncharacterized protein n=1 Tax=Fistulina hepatica ATCC 64428 TaxID=1128425 RepID=A0A0D7AK74_9AGAR|nr:hypothetical protein FISHEDRAFT_69936 [Fistulina hepatica ATCC 64428]
MIRVRLDLDLFTSRLTARSSVQGNEEASLVFQTIPVAENKSTRVTDNSTKTDVDGRLSPASDASTKNMVALIPRLVSVVEIIKREYLKLLEEKKSPRMHGLHQYNEICTLEKDNGSLSSTNDVAQVDDDGRPEMIISALEGGRNYPRQTQTPYMRITLSLNELPGLIARGATYQAPAQRKLSKAAKARARKAKKAVGRSASDPSNDVMGVDGQAKET